MAYPYLARFGVVAVMAACGGNGSAIKPDASAGHDSATGSGSDAGNATPVTFTLKNMPLAPATFGFAVGYQDGNGAWQAPPPPDETGMYSFTIYSPTWSFAWMCATPGDGKTTPQVNLSAFSVAEKTSFTQTVSQGCSDSTPATPATLTINATNVTATTGTYYATFAGTTVAMVPGTTAGTGTFTLTVPISKRDLVIGHNANTILTGAGSTDVLTDLALVQRGLSVTADQTIAIDFSQAVATQPVTMTATGKVVATTTLSTMNGTTVKLAGDSSSPYQGNGLADSDARATDLYVLQLSSSGTGTTALAQSWLSAPVGQTYVEPLALGSVVADDASTAPYPIIETSWPSYTNAIGYRWQATQPATGTATVAWSAQITPGYLAASPTYTMPDLSVLADWTATLAPAAGTPTSIRITAMTSSQGAADFPFLARPPVLTQRTQVTGTITITP